ncbi:Hypothetical predicted protein [Scomber scombrus]|uniref:Uncharacterized protein n=1 Tax=Scomber scombrus TaxID=13677 RepID=A0AAV1NR51_SCOSC
MTTERTEWDTYNGCSRVWTADGESVVRENTSEDTQGSKTSSSLQPSTAVTIISTNISITCGSLAVDAAQ